MLTTALNEQRSILREALQLANGYFVNFLGLEEVAQGHVQPAVIKAPIEGEVVLKAEIDAVIGELGDIGWLPELTEEKQPDREYRYYFTVRQQ